MEAQLEKCSVLLTVVIACTFGALGTISATAETIQPSQYNVALVEFSIDATSTNLRKIVRCSPLEVSKGVHFILNWRA